MTPDKLCVLVLANEIAQVHSFWKGGTSGNERGARLRRATERNEVKVCDERKKGEVSELRSWRHTRGEQELAIHRMRSWLFLLRVGPSSGVVTVWIARKFRKSPTSSNPRSTSHSRMND